MRRSLLVTGVAGVLVVGASALGGPLNPPAGPIASTGKTVGEVEPRTVVNATNTPGTADTLYRISVPGSYYLAQNVTGVPGRHGIVIESDNVTIDLAGFSVVGVAGSRTGILCSNSNRRGLTLKNGTVSAWGDDGVSVSASGSIIEGIVSHNNASDGISVGPGCIVRSCIASENRWGITASFAAALIESCTASGNLQTGFIAYNSIVRGCAARQNGSVGFFGSSTFQDCAAVSNTPGGFHLEGPGGVLERCTSSGGGEDGVHVVGGAWVIRANTSMTNAGAGIGVTGANTQARIDGNACSNNGRGVQIDSSTKNVIVRNVCQGNTTLNWDIWAGNSVGRIMVAPTNLSAVNGDTFGDPNANLGGFTNFTY